LSLEFRVDHTPTTFAIKSSCRWECVRQHFIWTQSHWNTLRAATGAGTLAQQVAREANILAFNDVFMLVGVLAVLALLWGIYIRWSIWSRGEISPVVLLQKKLQEAAAAQASASKAERQ